MTLPPTRSRRPPKMPNTPAIAARMAMIVTPVGRPVVAAVLRLGGGAEAVRIRRRWPRAQRRPWSPPPARPAVVGARRVGRGRLDRVGGAASRLTTSTRLPAPRRPIGDRGGPALGAFLLSRRANGARAPTMVDRWTERQGGESGHAGCRSPAAPRSPTSSGWRRRHDALYSEASSRPGTGAPVRRRSSTDVAQHARRRKEATVTTHDSPDPGSARATLTIGDRDYGYFASTRPAPPTSIGCRTP